MNEDPLYTKWGEKFDKKAVLTEYPRPQMQRERWLCLNGEWDFAIDGAETASDEWQGKIVVPFSPEAPLSGVHRQLLPGEYLHYRLEFSLPADYFGGRLLLHFGAVDQECRVTLNGAELGRHVGGYLPFTFDITGCARENNTLTVDVKDDSDESFHARGKQKLERGGIWYTAQSGIWGSVWIEPVPEKYVRSIHITPLFDEHCVVLRLAAGEKRLPCRATVTDGENSYEAAFYSDESARIDLPFFRAWSPEYPFLYNLRVTAGEDVFTSYFGMRKFSVEERDGTKRLCLNGEPYFGTGVLDQGYWPDGLYTAPSDEAMVADISDMKRLGFNTLRKHIKIEPLRWYYHCDRLGMIVWQDMPAGGGKYKFSVVSALPVLGFTRLRDNLYRRFGREQKEGRDEFLRDLDDTVDLLYNCVSLAVWVPFNEGWGQFDSAKAASRLEALDGTRIIDRASGWHDQGGGDLRSLHIYFRKFRMVRDDRAVALTEFGGYNLHVEGHCANDEDYGYRRYRSFEQLSAAIGRLYREEIIPAAKNGLSAAIYTQLSDVEDEQNGILTYDRKICKLPPDLMRGLNAELTK